MTILAKILASVLFFFLFTTPSTGETISLKIRSDNRPMILFEKFGFTNTGFTSVAISSVSVTSTLSQPDPSCYGFFLISEESLFQVLHELQQNPDFCILYSKYISQLFTFRDLSPPPLSSFNKSFPVTYPSEYSLFFANCNPESLVTMDVHIELYNTINNTSKDYLSPGLTQLPSLYFIFSLIYLCFLAFWIFMCFKNHRSIQKIHLLMGGLLVMTVLTLTSAAVDKSYVKATGTPHGWNVLFYVLNFLRVLLLFTVIMLIGSGWSFPKPFMQEKSKKALMVVIALQVVANIASIVIVETGPFIMDWMSWNQVFLVLELISYCVVIFHIVRCLRETFKTDVKQNSAEVTLLRLFYIVVIGYLLFTRIGVFVLTIVVDYKQQWVSNAAKEAASVLLYMAMFYMFRPVEKNEYIAKVEDEADHYVALDNEDEAAAKTVFKGENGGV